MLLMVLAIAEMTSVAAQSVTASTMLIAPSPVVPGAPEAASMPPAAMPAPTPTPMDNAAADATTNPASPPPPANPSPAAIPDAGAAAPASATVVADAAPAGSLRDPWVKINRSIFNFDIGVDKALLAPVSRGYIHVVPHVVRFHITSALFNLGEPLTATNDILQLRFGSAGKAVYRFIINSTLGVAGLFDLAGKGGVPIHISDFGQTLGRYGFKPGPYIMLPLLGPSDLRDGFGRLVDNFIDPVEFLIGGITSPEGISLFLLEGVDWRQRSEDTLKAVYSATDPYAFARSAYTQIRSATVLEATGKQADLPDFDAAPGTN